MCLDLFFFLFAWEISQCFVSDAVTHCCRLNRHLLTYTRHHIENELHDLLLSWCSPLLSSIFVCVQKQLTLSSIFETFCISGQSSKEERISHISCTMCWGNYFEVVASQATHKWKIDYGQFFLLFYLKKKNCHKLSKQMSATAFWWLLGFFFCSIALGCSAWNVTGLKYWSSCILIIKYRQRLIVDRRH